MQTFSMPKEADHLEDGGGKESNEERTEDASEEMVRKRVRANTPSPHRGNTPQGEKRVVRAIQRANSSPTE